MTPIKKKSAQAPNETGADQFVVVQTKGPSRVVLACPNCGTTLHIAEKIETVNKTVTCLSCHAEFMIQKK